MSNKQLPIKREIEKYGEKNCCSYEGTYSITQQIY